MIEESHFLQFQKTASKSLSQSERLLSILSEMEQETADCENADVSAWENTKQAAALARAARLIQAALSTLSNASKLVEATVQGENDVDDEDQHLLMWKHDESAINSSSMQE